MSISNADLGNCAASEPFALRVIGDDMAPEFTEGHIIIVDPGGVVRSGCFVVVEHQGEMMLRQLHIEEGVYRVSALNSDDEAVELEHGLTKIVGVISQRSGRRRKEHKRYIV